MSLAIIISIFALIISIVSAYINYKQYRSSEKRSDKFKDSLIKNMQDLKRTILTMDSDLDEKNKILFVETLHDLMLYQINEKDKINFLTKEQNRLLSELQVNIEDCIGNIFAKIRVEDIEFNRGMAVREIQSFLKKI